MIFDSEALIKACEPLLEIEVSAEAMPGVKFNLEIAARMAALVMDFALDDDAEPAPVFAP